MEQQGGIYVNHWAITQELSDSSYICVRLACIRITTICFQPLCLPAFKGMLKQTQPEHLSDNIICVINFHITVLFCFT